MNADRLAGQAEPPAQVWCVGTARFDAASRLLTRDGVGVELDDRLTDLLVLLLSRAGRTVPKAEILERLWPDRMVTEASLTKCVRLLRLALGDQTHSLVRTVHGQGFRIEAQPAPPDPAPSTGIAPRRVLASPARSWRWLAAAALLILLAGVAATWTRQPSVHAVHVPPEAAYRLYVKGMQDWAQRTPSGLTASLDEFSAATRLDPAYAEAYVGLANSYSLMREYAGMPSAQAFALAGKAAEQALRLDPDLAGAHAAHAFVLFWGDWDFQAALAEYQRALRLEPGNPGFHHWYATSLDNIGDRDRALAQIDRALELSPDSRAIRADRAIILFHMGRAEEARAILSALAASDPGFSSPHVYLAEIALATGEDASYLREAALCAAMMHNPAGAAIVAAAKAGHASGGHVGMIRALLAARLAAFETGGAGAAEVASAYALAGDHAAALRMLGQAIDRHEERAVYVVNDPGLRLLVAEPASGAILARLRLPQGGQDPLR